MATLSLKFAISDKLLPVIDNIRDPMSRDDFFRKALEIGIGELIEASIRMNSDYLRHTLAGQTKDYRQGRAVLRVDDPEAPNPAAEVVERRFSNG